MDGQFYFAEGQSKLDCVEQGRVDSIGEHCRKIREGKNEGCFWQCLQFENDPIYGCEHYET